MTEPLYPRHASGPVPEVTSAIEALRLVEYGSCDGCRNHNNCVVCGANAHGWFNDAIDDYVYESELHEKDCAVGKALGRCKP